MLLLFNRSKDHECVIILTYDSAADGKKVPPCMKDAECSLLEEEEIKSRVLMISRFQKCLKDIIIAFLFVLLTTATVFAIHRALLYIKLKQEINSFPGDLNATENDWLPDMSSSVQFNITLESTSHQSLRLNITSDEAELIDMMEKRVIEIIPEQETEMTKEQVMQMLQELGKAMMQKQGI